MRLWTIDPSQLDTKGLVALWRESLLAQAVLLGKTKGYKNHPQLDRWRNRRDALETYLHLICREAKKKEYNFDQSRIVNCIYTQQYKGPISVTSGQIDYEVKLLQSKLDKRSPGKLVERKICPIFIEVPGEIEPWEKVKKF